MNQNTNKTVLILGANSDVAKQCIIQYLEKGFSVIAASRNTKSLEDFVISNNINASKIKVLYFDAADFDSHQKFYNELPVKPHIAVYAAGFLVDNEKALRDFKGAQQMMVTNYMGAVSILNIIAMDNNKNLERIIGLSSLSGVRGRKSNFIYGSTKAAFTQYLAGLRQELASRKITVNVLVIGYIRTKINEGLELNESLIMEPDYVAKFIVNAKKTFSIVPNFKWKIIYHILKILPESLVAKLP